MIAIDLLLTGIAGSGPHVIKTGWEPGMMYQESLTLVFHLQPFPARRGDRPEGGHQNQGCSQKWEGLQCQIAELSARWLTLLESAHSYAHQDRGWTGVQVCWCPSKPHTIRLRVSQALLCLLDREALMGWAASIRRQECVDKHL